jgi:hypothetical protein
MIMWVVQGFGRNAGGASFGARPLRWEEKTMPISARLSYSQFTVVDAGTM